MISSTLEPATNGLRRVSYADKGKALLSKLFLGLPAILLVYLAVIPMVLLLLSGFKPGGLAIDEGFTIAHYVKVYSSYRTYLLIFNTLVFAVGSTSVMLVFTVLLAWIIERTNVPLKGWLRTVIIAPMGIPMMLIAMGWVLLASPKIGLFNHLLMSLFGLATPPLNIYSFPGMILVQGITMVPSSFLLLCFTFRNMDPSFEDASMVCGRGLFFTARRIVLPLLLPGILAVSTLGFVISLAAFDIPGVIGLPAKIQVLSSEIFLSLSHTTASGLPDFGAASALASVFFVTILVLSYVYNQQTKASAKFTTITGREFKPKIMNLGRWRYPAFAFVIGYILLVIGFPLLTLVWQSLTSYYAPFSVEALQLVSLRNYLGILRYPMLAPAVWNTLIVAGVTATTLVFLATIISWIIVRSQYRARRMLDVLCMLPMGMPYILLGLALIYVYLTFKIGIYGTIWIIVVAYITRFITYGTRMLNSTMFQIHKELEEAAQVSGASLARIFKTILMPILTPSLVGLWVWVLIHSMRELSAALILQSHKNFLITTLMWHFWEKGDLPKVATMGVGLVVFLFLVMGIGQLVARRSQFYNTMG